MTAQPPTPITSAPSSSDAPVLTAGAMLREARERMGMSVEDVAHITRIQRTMLNHLEHDRFEEYSAPVFIRGHLTNYAREVRLDPNKVLAAFERQTGYKRPTLEPAARPRPRREAAAPAPAPRARQPRQMPRPNVRLPEWAGLHPKHIVMAALILFGIVALVNFTTSESATAKDTTEFPTTAREDWSLEQDTRETRWLLDQPEQLNTTTTPR